MVEPVLPSPARRVGWAFALVMVAGCGPKSTEHRRTVSGAVVQAPPPTPPEAETEVKAWHTGARQFAATDPSGSPYEAWRIDLGTALVHPLSTDGVAVYGTGNGEVFSVGADGSERWRTRVNATGGLSVRAAGVSVPTTDQTFIDLDPGRGTIEQTHVAGGVVMGRGVPVGGELVWVTDAGKVIAESGWMVPASDSAVGVPSSDDLQIYFGTKTGEVVAASRARVRWRAVLPGPIVGGLISADGLVFAAYTGELGRPGGVAAMAADTGTVAWRMPLTEDPAAAPALGRLLIVPDRAGEVVALDPATGNVAWRTDIGGSPSTAPALGEFGLYVGNADGRLHRFDPDDGGQIWAIQLGATPSADPILLPGLVVVGLADGSLVAVGGR